MSLTSVWRNRKVVVKPEPLHVNQCWMIRQYTIYHPGYDNISIVCLDNADAACSILDELVANPRAIAEGEFVRFDKWLQLVGTPICVTCRELMTGQAIGEDKVLK